MHVRFGVTHDAEPADQLLLEIIPDQDFGPRFIEAFPPVEHHRRAEQQPTYRDIPGEQDYTGVVFAAFAELMAQPNEVTSIV